ncbi:mitochondrial potassium channel-like isoform X2 [Lutzomyia longipalpis]|uniref:mitochondrial potassium channel-like isoform X2 n=1 Tax=Lutzomyia longipalpis TaxID=7200 RepID=UPI002483D586|nr:mitochondrial potassium channel-like isoform X2 [Lutzomyia longipalpis]
MSVILRTQSVRFTTNRHIYMPPSVINLPLKNIRAFASKSLPPTLLDKSTPETSKSVATWIKIRYDGLIGTYEELSGLKEVRLAQEEVVRIQEKVLHAQEKRRETQLKLLEIRKSCRDLENSIIGTDKGKPLYLELVRRQVELMQEERQIEEFFNLMDTNERELFTHLTSAVQKSHEKERSQAENIKFFSMLLGLFSALLGILGATLTNHYRNRQYRLISEQDFQRLMLKLTESERANLKSQKTESWSSYFYRHGSNVYRWFVPKTQ